MFPTCHYLCPFCAPTRDIHLGEIQGEPTYVFQGARMVALKGVLKGVGLGPLLGPLLDPLPERYRNRVKPIASLSEE